MTSIFYLPLDERPCNAVYPINAAEVADWEILTPPVEWLGSKKQPADTERLWRCLEEQIEGTDAAVLSCEMLVYGGLLPSRLHHLEEMAIESYANRLADLKARRPSLKIYLSNLIMRTPRYSSSDEEPDYYADYGKEIFRHGELTDKAARQKITPEEEAELAQLKQLIPAADLEDYETRRRFNVALNLKNIELVEAGTIDFLVIPQDDSAEYGYTAIDQKQAYQKIAGSEASLRIMVYPGADEVGWTLLARAYNELNQVRPKIFPLFASTLGPSVVPLYEDRIIGESMKAHIMAAGCVLTDDKNESDLILAYNTPGKWMQESWDQFEEKDVTYSSYRHLLTFVDQMATEMAAGRKVILCDAAFANGGDLELLRLLEKHGITKDLLSYKAWNTNCNSLGSSIAAGVFARNSTKQALITRNLLHHFYEDLFYQAIIRMDLTHQFLPSLGLNYFDLKDQADQVTRRITDDLEKYHRQFLQNSFEEPEHVNVSMPWNRMFEIHCTINS
ncbi:DUF4127 family protein [Listeria costaricensis]|uniref:DUF4127 family protein n=1 Tax=Listeria costaricensis TaxID=2026604 RepID=UPI000C07305D|nr:DUF4127 family protein [Listeria costaricensis]